MSGRHILLEATFQNLVDQIISVQNSHKESTDEKDMLSRNWEFIFSEFNGWIVLYCSTLGQAGGYWIYPMLYPSKDVICLKNELPKYSFSPSSVGYSHVMSGEKQWIEPYWKEDKKLTDSEVPLFFLRQYYGYAKGKENYYEFNQLVTHPLDLHWSTKNQAYCRLNDQGEEIEKIKVINHDKVSLILMRKKTLENLLHLGDWNLIRYFSFNRFNAEFPSFQDCASKIFEPTEYEAIFEIRTCKNEYAEFRGAQIMRPETPKAQFFSWDFSDNEEEGKKYAEFTVQDWKNKQTLKNYSLNPKNFSNYFTKSDLPFETSPIFFKAEVLDKYKNDHDKYDLTERTISCRGGWYLQTYDINEYNQVHTYAIYLGRLPYKEQLHWLQYNEEPKGPISKRSVQTDFEAKFPDEKSKLELLKEFLFKLGDIKIGELDNIIWSPKGGSWESASKGLHYVNSENANEWHDFIIALTNTVNEGFQLKPLRRVAAYYGDVDKTFGTLGLLKTILIASNNVDKIPTIHGTLNGLQIKRGKGKAHGTWDSPEASLIQDAAERLQSVILAIESLVEVFNTLELPESDTE